MGAFPKVGRSSSGSSGREGPKSQKPRRPGQRTIEILEEGRAACGEGETPGKEGALRGEQPSGLQDTLPPFASLPEGQRENVARG